jgi:hypothetical protein
MIDKYEEVIHDPKNQNYPSGNGERGAQLGYYPQYCIAVDKIYKGLLEGTFESISIADPKAGAVDDILIVSTDRVDAYQVKWSEKQGYLSFKDFIYDSTGADSLFGKLAHGWKIISEKYHVVDTFVHFITYNLASSNKKAKVEIEDNFYDGTFYDFVLSWNNKTLLSNKTSKIFFTNLSKHLGFDIKFFEEFYNFSFFHFGFSNPFDRLFDQASKKEDYQALYQLIGQCVGGQERIINLSKNDLITKLGWNDRFELQFSHDFPSPVKYEPIQTSIIELKTILENISSGYVALTGTPGSGKSTTLSQYFMENKLFRYVSYFAYIPDSYFFGTRGESASFFSDITKQLEHWGFKGNIDFIPRNLEDFKKKLGKQFQEVYKKYKEDHIKTIIIIDGLDHIVREQNPHISLLKDLPPPENIPDGILIILGTQTLQLNDMLPAIRNQLNKDRRTLTIKSLTKIQTYNLLEKYSLSQLQEKEKELIFQKTGGHPLFLTYAIQLLKNNMDINVLGQYENFIDTIENMYIPSWEQIKMNQNIIDILAIISRFRLPFDPEKFLLFVPRQDLFVFIEKFSHYFKKGKDWSFYHNSLRQFLLQKTKETPFGNQDENIDKKYYKKLSGIIEKTDDKVVCWELIYTLFHADEIQKILSIATQDYFREQFFELRPYDEIKNDISILLQISKSNLNFDIVLRCLLIEKELQERERILEELDIITLLFKTYGVSALFSLIQSPMVKYSVKEYFKISLYLYQNGYIEEARAIYEQHIPLQYLSGNVPYAFNYNEEESLLDSWIEIALLFQSIKEIVGYIEQVKMKNDRFSEQEEVNHKVLHRHLINVLSKKLLYLNQTDKVIDFIEIYNYKVDYVSIVFNMCLQIEHKKLFNNNIEFREKIRSIIISYLEKNELDESEQLKIAEFYYNINIEKSKYYAININQVIIDETNEYSKNNWFYKTIRLNRLLAALNIIKSPKDIIPDPDDSHYFGNALYLRILIIFSQFEGIIDRGGYVGNYDFIKNVKYTIWFIQKPYNETREWYSWHMLENTFSELYRYIINIGNKIGNGCIETLKEIFIKNWNSNTYWLLDTKRVIINELIKFGANRDNLIPILNNLFDIIKNDTEADSRVSSYFDFINTFHNLNIKKDYSALFRDLLEGSFAIHSRKDYQIQDWLFWLELYTKNYPEKSSDDLEKFLSALSSLYNKKGGGIDEAIQKILYLVAYIDPNKAFYMLQWLLDSGICDYTSSLIGFISGILIFDTTLCVECLLIYQKLIIPFNPSTSSDIIKILVDSLYKNFKYEIVEEYIISLIKTIDTELLSTSRRRLLMKLETAILLYNSEKTNILEIIKNSIEIAPEILENQYDQITYIRKEFKNFNELYIYLEENDKNENLDMYYIVMNLVETITENDIEPIKKLQKRGIFGIKEVITIGQTIEKLFGKNIVENLYDDFLETTDQNGWSIQWNGAPRLQFYKELIRINSKKWKELAFHDFINTYININRYPYYYLEEWKNINDIFCNNIESYIEGYWKEMKQHIYKLTDFKNTKDIPKYTINNDTHLSIILKLVVYLLKLPIPDFQIKSHQAIFGIIEKNIDKLETIDTLNNLLDIGGLVTNKALLVLDCLCDKYINFVKKYKDKILNLATNIDMSIRLQSRNILTKLNIKNPEIEYRPLPDFYSLFFDENKINFKYKDIKAHEVLPNATSISDFVRIFDSDVQLLSKTTGIEYNTIAMRILMIARKLEPESMWDENAEKKMINWLKNINQELIYNRPRPQIIKRALNILLGEIIDANMMPDNVIHLVCSSIAKRVSKYLSLVSPNITPSIFKNNPFIIEWKNDIHRRSEKWIENINFDMHTIFSKYKDKIIIGAYIIFSYFDRGKPTEEDITCICFEDMVESINEKEFLLNQLNTLSFYSSDLYPKLYIDMPKSLTIYCSEIGIDHCGISWMAFNPEIALKLNWKLDNSEGLFKWINSNKKIMVESIYFSDGSLALQPPRSDLFCSKGWLVLASEEAINQIKNAFHNIYRIDYTKRSFVENDEKCNKSLYRKIKI